MNVTTDRDSSAPQTPQYSELVQARVDADTRRRLKARAKQEFRRESDVIRLALLRYLRTPAQDAMSA